MAPEFQEVAQATPIILIIVIVILLLIIIWLLLRRPKPISPTVEYFVRDQVLITGPEDGIARVRERILAELQIELRPKQSVPNENPNEPEQQLRQAAAIRNARSQLFQMVRVGEAGREKTAVDVAQAINDMREPDVSADANYKIGRPVLEVSGDPLSGEGYAVGPIGGQSAEQQFYNQWALHINEAGKKGIALFDKQFNQANGNQQIDNLNVVLNNRKVKATGEGTMVVVFDTSPFDETEHLVDKPLDPTQPAGIERQVSQVTHNALPGVPDARDHGVFGASLVNVVAPKSDVRLIRVLNDSNRGTLSPLVEALQTFIDEQKAQNPASFAKMVINLSLGVHPGPDTSSIPPIPTLYNALKEAYDLGAVIVAASGNDSANGVPKPAQIPATYDFVIGVGASNGQSERACFSNLADVYAPGGDNNTTCGYEPDGCIDGSEECVIGYAYRTSETRFAYWKGTSFAAPLVSGLAALLLEKGIPGSKVKERILAKASVTSGSPVIRVINVPDALDSLP